MNADSEPMICCCGHARALHPYGGMCNICRRSCEKFHAPGQGHSPLAHAAFILFLVVVGCVLIVGLWVLVCAITGVPFIPF